MIDRFPPLAPSAARPRAAVRSFRLPSLPWAEWLVFGAMLLALAG